MKKLKLLLIDSDSTIALAIFQNMTHSGLFKDVQLKLSRLKKSEEAFLNLKKESYDLIITERVDDDFIINIKRLAPSVPVIAFTSNSEPDLEEYCLEAGFAGFLMKAAIENLPKLVFDCLPQVGG